jgi:septal ring factor EnvC (AmiA/AmiB activator)
MVKKEGGVAPPFESKAFSPAEVRTVWRERTKMRDQRLKKVNHENNILRKENRQFEKDNGLLELVIDALKLKIQALETLRRIDDEDLTRLENALRERDKTTGPLS